MPVFERARPAKGRSRRLTPSEIERVFGALSHDARRQIVLVLSHYGPELPSGYLAKRFTHSWPTTTRHLHVLEAAGVVSVRSEGRNCWYRLNRDYVRRVVGGWLELLDPPTGGEIWRSPRPSIREEGTRVMTELPKLFRVTLEVSDLEAATQLYQQLFAIDGTRHPGARHYFDCDGVIVAVIDVSQGGLTPTPGPKSLSFAVDDIEAIHQRAARLEVLAPYQVHGEPAGDVVERPWGERSFYIVDPWGNDLCFCHNGTLFT